jgi:hypothetical protein
MLWLPDHARQRQFSHSCTALALFVLRPALISGRAACDATDRSWPDVTHLTLVLTILYNTSSQHTAINMRRHEQGKLDRQHPTQ